MNWKTYAYVAIGFLFLLILSRSMIGDIYRKYYMIVYTFITSIHFIGISPHYILIPEDVMKDGVINWTKKHAWKRSRND